jgi:hypothetical protein
MLEIKSDTNPTTIEVTQETRMSSYTKQKKVRINLLT